MQEHSEKGHKNTHVEDHHGHYEEKDDAKEYKGKGHKSGDKGFHNKGYKDKVR